MISQADTMSPMWHEENLLIGGELVPAEGGKTYDVYSPFSEERLGVAADASLGDVRSAIDAARRAFDATGWSTDRELRLDCLRKFHEALLENTENLRSIVVHECGAPIRSTRGAHLETPLNLVPYFAGLLETYEFCEAVGELDYQGRKSRCWIEREPVGVVAAICAYNSPVQLALAKLSPALAAGCTVVLKGAPQTPWVNLTIGRLAAGIFPPGVVNVITSSSSEVATELTTHPDVDSITFTGSTPVGKKIMAAASETMKRVFLELGGKSALVCLDDGDLQQAVTAAGFATCSHAGQGCAITSRLVVPRERVSEAAAMAASLMRTVAYGDPADPATQMGPLISKAQQDKVAGYVDRALAAGARLVTGGSIPSKPGTGFFYEPTVVIADEDSEIAQEELFGPVLVILPHDGDDDAVRVANNSAFGLSGSVSSADPDRARSFARRVRTGTFGINGGGWFGPNAPFGGMKQSGVGRENGVPSMEEFLEIKTLAEPVV